MKVGIDFSLNSPGIAIKKETEYKFYSLFNYSKDNFWERFKDGKMQKAFSIHKELKEQECISIHPYNRNVKSKEFLFREREKLTDANFISELIIDILKNEIVSENYHISLEGFSYGSKGNSFIDMIQYNTFLRHKLLEEFDINKISFFQPSHVKKLAGKGNANKFYMIKAFQEDVLNDKELRDTKLWNWIKDKDYSKKIPKPIDDIVDSYFILNCFKDT
tara:strand:- start:60369 stop:61025 length:657 start_codon:yes stop_codon:yes gene_type:complete